MDVTTKSPLRVASLDWQPRPGELATTLIAKATFVLRAEVLALSSRPDPLEPKDRAWADDPTRSVLRASDLVPRKPLVDVLLVGHAFAPHGVPTRATVTRLQIGDIDKSIEVFCDRELDRTGKLHDGSPWTRMPLIWERALGGPGRKNPFGIGARSPEDGVPVAIANLQRVGRNVKRRSDAIEPACFAPLPASWPDRASLLTGRAVDLDTLTFEDGFDFSYFNVAPLDQRLAALDPRAELVLDGLSPRSLRIVTRLPGLTVRALLEHRTGTSSLEMRADTLSIDTDRALVCVTWRAELAVDPSSPIRAARLQLLDGGAPIEATGSHAGHTALDDALEEARDDAAVTLHRAPSSTPPRTPSSTPPRTPSSKPPTSSAGRAALSLQGGAAALSALAASKSARASSTNLEPTPFYEASALLGVELIGADATLTRADDRELRALFARAEIASPSELAQRLVASMRADSDTDSAAPSMLEGELELTFDDAATLRATLAVASLAPRVDAHLRDEVLAAEAIASLPPSTLALAAAEAVARLVEAFARSSVAGFMEAQTERLLLEERAYRRRVLLGEEWLRALFAPADGAAAIPCYLPARLAHRLPIFRRFHARILAELVPRQDQYEEAPVALRVRALARVHAPR